MIEINEDLCKGCHLCLFMCYKNVYAIPQEANMKGVLLPYVKFEERCTACGVCEVVCPDQAITVDVDKAWWTEKGNQWKFNPKFSGVTRD